MDVDRSWHRTLNAVSKQSEQAPQADDTVCYEGPMYSLVCMLVCHDATGDYTPDLGRTPMAAQDPTLQNVAQSTGYEMKEGDKQLQPEKKKGWFF